MDLSPKAAPNLLFQDSLFKNFRFSCHLHHLPAASRKLQQQFIGQLLLINITGQRENLTKPS
uniref:Uncharacterized protein n=1 Tax=Phlebotomus papatasi TaxID=29031 RepID=A0A1B0DQH7_PHLPP